MTVNFFFISKENIEIGYSTYAKQTVFLHEFLTQNDEHFPYKHLSKYNTPSGILDNNYGFRSTVRPAGLNALLVSRNNGWKFVSALVFQRTTTVTGFLIREHHISYHVVGFEDKNLSIKFALATTDFIVADIDKVIAKAKAENAKYGL